MYNSKSVLHKEIFKFYLIILGALDIIDNVGL